MKLFLLSTVALFVSVYAIGFTGNGGGGNGGNGGTPECPFAYKLFKRPNGRYWCMKYFPGNETFFGAEKICRCQGGASLSGIENYKELSYVLGESEKSFESIGIKTGGVWVGAYRRKDCRVENMATKPECTKEYQYQWTDRNTMGNDMWKTRWTEGAPHNNKVGTHQEFCVQLQVSIDPAILNKNLTGFFDNRVCVHPDGETQFPTEGFVCGRPPKFTGGSYYGAGGGNGVGGMIIIGAGKPTKKP
ncbi:hypothetical protein CRE_28705 [Caenorhabditis remanei]|uniref:C-type lectin domain-containing protein n=1 Tax=Caenorhabditis remanei TaxID=31234 RepID=E3MK38_CAERE|nr:hypothetical protein CRE_28705 [Caenorhabditis remanei]